MISGRPPFTGDTPVAIAYQHVSGAVTPATQLQPTLNSMVDNFISVALAKNPDDRYQSAIAMLDDLKRLARGEAITREIPRTKTRQAIKSGFDYFCNFIGVRCNC